MRLQGTNWELCSVSSLALSWREHQPGRLVKFPSGVPLSLHLGSFGRSPRSFLSVPLGTGLCPFSVTATCEGLHNAESLFHRGRALHWYKIVQNGEFLVHICFTLP